MVLCRFFQQGNCRYGNNCRFEHSGPAYQVPDACTVSPLLRNSQQQQTAPPTLEHQNVFARQERPNLYKWNASKPQTTQQHGFAAKSANNPTDLREVYEILLQELEIAERCGQWPLSCFNPQPLRAHGNIPGLEDHSPEELRYLLYEARASGNLESCNQHIKLLHHESLARRNALKNPSAEIFSMLEALLRGPPPAALQFPFSLSGNVAQDSWPAATTNFTSSPLFSSAGAGSLQQSGCGIQPQQTAFGGSSNAAQQTSIFGGASPSSQSPSIFGGNSSNQASSFGSTLPMPFGSSSQNPSNFSGASPLTSYGPQTNCANIFGGSAPPTSASSTFTFSLPNLLSSGQVAPTSSFTGHSANGQNLFASPVAQPAVNIFSGFQSVPSSQPDQGGSLFVTPGGISGNSSAGMGDSSLHTAMSNITEEEKKEFLAATFTVGSIPVHAPPKELCSFT